MNQDTLNGISIKLDLILSVLLENSPNTNASLTEKALKLDALGIPPAEIGKILRKPTNQITDILAKQRKKRSRG